MTKKIFKDFIIALIVLSIKYLQQGFFWLIGIYLGLKFLGMLGLL